MIGDYQLMILESCVFFLKRNMSRVRTNLSHFTQSKQKLNLFDTYGPQQMIQINNYDIWAKISNIIANLEFVVNDGESSTILLGLLVCNVLIGDLRLMLNQFNLSNNK